jgi:hypothetical protein
VELIRGYSNLSGRKPRLLLGGSIDAILFFGVHEVALDLSGGGGLAFQRRNQEVSPGDKRGPCRLGRQVEVLLEGLSNIMFDSSE